MGLKKFEFNLCSLHPSRPGVSPGHPIYWARGGAENTGDCLFDVKNASVTRQTMAAPLGKELSITLKDAA